MKAEEKTYTLTITSSAATCPTTSNSETYGNVVTSNGNKVSISRKYRSDSLGNGLTTGAIQNITSVSFGGSSSPKKIAFCTKTISNLNNMATEANYLPVSNPTNVDVRALAEENGYSDKTFVTFAVFGYGDAFFPITVTYICA